MEIPVLSADLIKQLDESVSKGALTSKDFSKADREIWFEAGQRSLVDNLKLSLKAQQEEAESLLNQS
jgi:hypothetical protein